MERDDIPTERHLADALRRLNEAAVVPPVDPAREAALLAAFDAAHARPVPRRRDHWHLAAFAAAAAVLVAVGLRPVPAGRSGASSIGAAPTRSSSADARLEAPGEFVIMPGASGLPAMESGTLVRMSVPVAMLPSLGVTPPGGRGATVTADFIVAQDGLPRAVRLVGP